MSDVKRYWLSTEGMCEARGAPGDIQGEWVRAEDYDLLAACAELLRRELEDCCTRMDRCKGILRADRQAPEGWNVLDTKHARAALAKNPAAANVPVVNETEGRPAPLPEASAGPEYAHETDRDLLRTIRDHPASNLADCTVGKTTLAAMVDAELRHQSCTQFTEASPDTIEDCKRLSLVGWLREITSGWLWTDEASSRPFVDALIERGKELEQELRHQVNRWIPVSVRLPVPEVVDGETADFVPILFYAGGMVCAGRFFPDFSARKRIYKWRSLQGMEFKDADVTHWMPLPAAPDSEFVACREPAAAPLLNESKGRLSALGAAEGGLSFQWGAPCAACGKPVHYPTSRHMPGAVVAGDKVWHANCPHDGTYEFAIGKMP